VKRDTILSGENTDFSEYVPKFDLELPIIEEIVAGCKASLAEKKAKIEEENGEKDEHVPTDVSACSGVAGVPNFWATAV